MSKIQNTLFYRNSPDVTRDLVSRTLYVRSDSIDEDNRSIEAVMSTEGRVRVFDWNLRRVVEEVLLSRGADLPEQVVLLETHSRWSLDDVLGSVRSIRNEDNKMVGRIFFAAGDERAERAWQKVKQGHISDVSVGYRVLEYVDIAPGKKRTIAGRVFEAGDEVLRVTTRWQIRELSLVPIGADPAAKIRDESGQSAPQQTRTSIMKKELREYLQSIGLRAEATDEEAQAFYDGLSGDQRIRAVGIHDGTIRPAPVEGQRQETPATPPPEPPANQPQGQRQETQQFEARLESTVEPQMSLENVRAEAAAAERARQSQIRQLATDQVPSEVVERAINEAWDFQRAALAFAEAVRDGRSPSVPSAPRAPAGHVRDREADNNRRSLASALLIQTGSDPTTCREYGTMSEMRGAAFTEQDADLGDRLRNLSAPDLFRECVRCDTGRYYRTAEEAIARVRDDRMNGRAAVSGGTLSYVFGTNVYAKLVEGWNEIGDSTAGWCDEEDVPNFLPQEEITLNLQGEPEQHGRGDTAPDITLSDSHETYRAYRFTRKGTVDEMDIINDRLGAVMKIPVLMGKGFRRMRPNLVYSNMLSNPKLVADGKAVFHADHGNLGAAALDADGLSAALIAMSSQRANKNKEMLDIRGRFLIVPTALKFSAAQLLNSVALAKTHADKSNPVYMPVNPVGPSILKQANGEDLTLVSDDRIGATGVWNPMTKAMVKGSATNWFLSSGKEHGVRVIYRRGTNRQPAVRSYVLDQGQWGYGWDMVLDMGCKIMGYRGLYESTGTG